MDKTNKPIMENGKPVVLESKFVAEKNHKLLACDFFLEFIFLSMICRSSRRVF